MRRKLKKGGQIFFIILLLLFLVECGHNNNTSEKKNELIENKSINLIFRDNENKKYKVNIKGLSSLEENFEEFGSEECSHLYKLSLIQKAVEENKDLPEEINDQVTNEFVNFGREFTIKVNPGVIGTYAGPEEIVKAIKKECKNGSKIIKSSPLLSKMKYRETGLMLDKLFNGKKNKE